MNDTNSKTAMTLGKKIIIGFIASIVILFGIALFSFKNSEKFIASNIWVDHTHQVLFEFQQILLATVNAESGSRGFVVAGTVNYLEPFFNANEEAVAHLSKVKELTKDNPNQQKNIEELDKEVKMRFTNLNEAIDFRKQGFEKAKNLVVSGEGKRIQDRIRKIVDRAQQIENRLLTERKQTSIDDARNFNLVFIILLLIIIIILIIVYSIVTTNIKTLKRAEAETADKNWLLSGNTDLNEKLIGDQSIEELANNTINFLCGYLKAQIGSVYLMNDTESTLNLSGQYAFSSPENRKDSFKLNEGFIGQAAQEKKQISVTDITEAYIRINSSVLNAKPKMVLITPFLFEGKTVGVIEIGRLSNFTDIENKFINVSMKSIAISINSAIARKQIKELLEESQVQGEELQTQQEELKQMNEELEGQANNLKQQQEELQITNE
jgi:CHASE3 domain sensor protein/putative methionine-R-sulfoxide reductase with GAF domain